MDKAHSARTWLLRTALSFLGTPYRWGGDDPSGFDCSGFVLECLKTVGLVGNREDLTADRLMHQFSGCSINLPHAGALLFTINSSGVATRVTLCLDRWFQIGAGGGDNTITDPADAWRANAFVRIRPIPSQTEGLILRDPFLLKQMSHPTRD